MGFRFRTTDELDACLDFIRGAPSDGGVIEMIVRRPGLREREVLSSATLDLELGLVGDTWRDRPSSRMPEGLPHPDMQITVVSARMLAAVAEDRSQWPLAGDQFYVDLDISFDNLPPGTQLALGTAVIEVTDQPHTGCAKFVERFGIDAARWVNNTVGKPLRLRGLNAKVVQPGEVSTGEVAKKLP